jgi:Zn-finger nucleic acid-binding protein
MEKRRARGVLLDFCPPCHGIWLDGGELEALRAGRARHSEELAEQEQAENEREESRAVTVLGLCPRCQRELMVMTVGGVEVDRCQGCGGMYFDQGELPAILSTQSAGLFRRLWARSRGR